VSLPFAWNGVFVFWIPAVVFGVQLVVNTVWLLRAINTEAGEPADNALCDGESARLR
jgi:hypothetical protein